MHGGVNRCGRAAGAGRVKVILSKTLTLVLRPHNEPTNNPKARRLRSARPCLVRLLIFNIQRLARNPGVKSVAMGSKRGNSTLSDPIPEPANKRRRDQASSKSKGAEQKPDATYGQRSAFGSLEHATHPSDDDLEFEDEGDALAYLKSVR